MKLHSALDIAGLLVGSVYCTIPLFWLVFHPFVERWRKYGRKTYLVIMPAWGIFIAVAFALGWPIRHLHLYESNLPWVMGVLFILAGLSIYRSASRGFDQPKVSGLAELEPDRHDQRLVITGIRAQVRHPIYLGHLCEIMGWTLGTGSLALCALLVFGVVTGAIMIHQEDAELEERFGDLYREYRSRVPALLPRFPG
jgi:protein-S-isoprenylcysteine O-methyltransferase Ste14